MPTILDAAQTSYPKEYDGKATIPMEGESILPFLQGSPSDSRILYFEHEGNRGVNDGKWKMSALRGKDWELYDLASDRTELVNLASKYPDVVHRLDSLWNNWARENYVTPLPTNYRMPYLPRQ